MHAVDDVDLEVGEGQLVGLIGPNGAGKTTFIDAITGFVRSSGRVELDGTDLTGLPPHARARRGLARTWQSIELFDDLTVAREPRASPSTARPSGGRIRETVTPPRRGDGESPPALELLGLERDRRRAAAELSQGQRKLVGDRPRARREAARCCCLDEPAAGLDTSESEELGGACGASRTRGQSMLLVDHDMGLVLGICDDVVVLEFGEVIARGAPDVVRRDPRVIAAYLGSAASRAGRDGRAWLTPLLRSRA